MIRLSVFTAITYLLIFSYGIIQAGNLEDCFQYMSPIPGAKLISKETTIILRQGERLTINRNDLTSLAIIEGSQSGIHEYKAVISDDQKTIILKPLTPFTPGETVTVSFTKTIENIIGSNSRSGSDPAAAGEKPDILTVETSYSFAISPKLSDQSYEFLYDEEFFGYSDTQNTMPVDNNGKEDVVLDYHPSLPSDFVLPTVNEINNPADGFVFLVTGGNAVRQYMLILDNTGYPIFYRDVYLPIRVTDFKMHPNGLLSYYQTNRVFYVMDSTYTVIDSFQCGNGYSTNPHDFQMLNNGHVLMMAYDRQVIDMSLIVPGGNPNCNVTGLIIQELDSLKNVVFQWRSWDHFEITDATHTDFTTSSIDAVHGNAFELDYDGNLLLSSRHLDEITKIDRQTGDIIWRLGLNAINNEFVIVSDTIGFSRQHDIRRIPNGNITLFDNGNYHTPQFSRAVEYELDEDNKICTLVWEYRHEPTDLYTFQLCNVQRLPNGNTMMSWGRPSPISLTEVSPDGVKEFELTLDGAPTTGSYRVFRFPWNGVAYEPYLLLEELHPGAHLIFNKFGDTSIVQYYIYAGDIPFPSTIMDSTSNNYFDIIDLSHYSTYYFRVTAVDSLGIESPFSNMVTIDGSFKLYEPGDINGDTLIDGSDVVFGINYFKGGHPPPDSCYNDSTSSWLYCAADVNGDCMFIGSDITYYIAYFHGQNEGPKYCPQTSPFE